MTDVLEKNKLVVGNIKWPPSFYIPYGKFSILIFTVFQ